jgi:hypothetical protein
MHADPRPAAKPLLHVLSVEPFNCTELLSKLRRTRLRGFDGAQPYAEATLSLNRQIDPATLAPAQQYVLRAVVARILELRSALLRFDLDIFALDGGVFVRTVDAPDERIVRIINDGLHRVFAARSVDLPITAVVAKGVPSEYPYYACAMPGGWSEVVELDELPDGFQKKTYRNPENYKALFRDFNGVFPGVQKERRKSNPPHLRA